MPSMQTLFRAVVMIVVGVVGFKAWKLYGPTNDQVKSTVTQVVETVTTAIRNWQRPTADQPPDPRNAAPVVQAPPVAPSAPSTGAIGQAEAPQLLPQSGPLALPPATGPPSAEKLTVDGQPAPAVSPTGGERTQQLVSRLKQLGAADTELVPWGSSGSLYRFTCRAPLANAPAMMQHFESIAADPAAAVEEVLLKVESSQIAQRESAQRRY